VYSLGEKPHDCTIDVKGSSSILVLVEDVLSAIVVGRHAAARPLFGSKLTDAQKDQIFNDADLYDTILVWLDKDKYPESIDIQRYLANSGWDARVVSTRSDPKDLDAIEIQRLVERYGLLV
jgi:hypothetical protein